MYINENQNSALMLNNTRKIKEKNTSSDEFQATLNELKNKEEKEYKKENHNTFSNNDLNIQQFTKDFKIYAFNKLQFDQMKQGENKVLNTLLKTIH